MHRQPQQIKSDCYSSTMLYHRSHWLTFFTIQLTTIRFFMTTTTSLVANGLSLSMATPSPSHIKGNCRSFEWPPHSGYHGPSSSNSNNKSSFFEGWYLRVVTQSQGSLAFIFHVFDPHHSETSKRQGVGCQVVTPTGTFRKESKDVKNFRAASHKLDVRNTFSSDEAATRTDFQDFFRLTVDNASGKITISSYAETVTIDFDFGIQPEVGWGTNDRQYSVAGFLAAFPVFEPHYQVLLSRGRVPSGGFVKIVSTHLDGDSSSLESPSLTTTTTIYDLTNATMYLEKNWGGSFPSRWFWIQANTFIHTSTTTDEQAPPSSPLLDLCVTSTGALRRLPFFGEGEQEEQVALIAVHWNGGFYPFPEVTWSIEWGRWVVRGAYNEYLVELTGTCDVEGFPVSCPTDTGMEDVALETFQGKLRVKLFQKAHGEQSGRVVLDAESSNACLEIGGLPWSDKKWEGESAMKEPIKSVAMNVGESPMLPRTLVARPLFCIVAL